MRSACSRIDCREERLALLRQRGDDPIEPALAVAREADPRATAVFGTRLADEEARLLCAADGTGDRVGRELQPFGDLVHRCSLVAARRALHHQ